MRLEKDLEISSGLTDSTANLSAIGVFQVLEDVVTELMGKLEVDGLTVRRKYNAMWLFVKNKVKLFKDIAWNENAKAIGFISAVTRATMCLDVAFKNSAEELCAYARLEICAIDLDTGRIRKISSVGVDDTFIAEPPLIDLEFGRAENIPLKEVDRVRIRYTNIDFSKHTNNKEYVRFILNTYSTHDMESKRIREIEVRYINQSFENDELAVCKGSLDNKDFFTVEKDGKPIFKCEIIF